MESYFIRKTTAEDLPAVMDIFSGAREFMAKSGNPGQWTDGHPRRAVIENDILAGTSYVCMRGDEISAVFYFNIERDPTYEIINGAWLNDEPYGVIHRIARAPDARGAGAFCINWCYEQIANIRIDTHEDNSNMLELLKKLGFTYCGIIHIENGDKRMAFHKSTLPR